MILNLNRRGVEVQRFFCNIFDIVFRVWFTVFLK